MISMFKLRGNIPPLAYALLDDIFTYDHPDDEVTGEPRDGPEPMDEQQWLVDRVVVEDAVALTNTFLLMVGARWAELSELYDENNCTPLWDLYLQKKGHGAGFFDRRFIPEDLREHLNTVVDLCPRFEPWLVYHDTGPNGSFNELHLYHG